jgi:hypothetical protein
MARTGHRPFWPLLRFEVVANGAVVAWVLIVAWIFLTPDSESGRELVGAFEPALWPLLALLLAWFVYTPDALGNALEPAHREFLLTRPVGRTGYYWAKTALLGAFLATVIVGHLWPAVFDQDCSVSCSWSEGGRYLAGLTGSSVHPDEGRSLPWAQRYDGPVSVWIPSGRLRVAHFEAWMIVCLTVLAQSVVVWLGAGPLRRDLWLPLGVATLLPAALLLSGLAGYRLLTAVEEWMLFAFDRHRVVSWLGTLAVAAATQWLNAGRFAKTELA